MWLYLDEGDHVSTEEFVVVLGAGPGLPHTHCPTRRHSGKHTPAVHCDIPAREGGEGGGLKREKKKKREEIPVLALTHGFSVLRKVQKKPATPPDSF